MTCERCGSYWNDAGDGMHECSSEPITPRGRDTRKVHIRVNGKWVEDTSDKDLLKFFRDDLEGNL